MDRWQRNCAVACGVQKDWIRQRANPAVPHLGVALDPGITPVVPGEAQSIGPLPPFPVDVGGGLDLGPALEQVEQWAEPSLPAF